MGYSEIGRHTLHHLGSPQLRNSGLINYIGSESLEYDPHLQIVQRPISVIIPAYNEELVLASTIQSMDEASQYADNLAEIVVVDNMSDDSTPQIVSDARNCTTPVTLMQNPIKGIAPTRKLGMDQIVVHHQTNPDEVQKRRIILMTDADTTFPITFIKSYMDLFKSKNPDMATGVYQYPDWVDQEIYTHNGIANFYTMLSQISLFLMQHSMSTIPTIGANTGIEVGSYAAVNGINKELKRSEDHDLGKKVRAKNGHIEIIPTTVYTSPRRALSAMANHVDFATTNIGCADIRCSDQELLQIVLNSNSKDAWTDERTLREGYIIFGRVTLPFLRGELSLEHMISFFGKKHPFVHQLLGLGIEKLKDENSCGEWPQEKTERIAKDFSFKSAHLLTESIKNTI